MKRMLRAAALLIAAALLSPCASALSACRAAVLDADTGEVCFARNASEHALIASTTKIMTGLLIAEDCDPDAVVTVPQEAVGFVKEAQFAVGLVVRYDASHHQLVKITHFDSEKFRGLGRRD